MKRRFAFAPAAIWALVILVLGSIPSLTPPVDFPFADKLAHFGMFAILGALLAYGLHRARQRPSLVVAILAGVAVGAIDELHQRSVPGRSSDPLDLAADVLGVVVGLWLTHRALERYERRTNTKASEPGRRAPDADSIQEPSA